MHVSLLYIIYVGVLILTYLTLSFTNNKFTLIVKALITLAVGGLALFLAISSIEIDDNQQRVWLGILVIFAYIAPLSIAIYLLYKTRYFNKKLVK
jgi:hypothetical protein